MKKHIRIILAMVSIALACVIGVSIYQHKRMNRYVSDRFEGPIVSYEETEDGLCVMIDDETGDSQGVVRCMPLDGIEMSDWMAYIISNRIVGAYVFASTTEFRYSDPLNADDYLYRLRTIGIQPVNWERLINEGKIKQEEYEAFLKTYQSGPTQKAE